MKIYKIAANAKRVTTYTILNAYLSSFIPQNCMITRKHFAVKNSIWRTWLSLSDRTTNLSWFWQHNSTFQKWMRATGTSKHCYSSHTIAMLNRICQCQQNSRKNIQNGLNVSHRNTLSAWLWSSKFINQWCTNICLPRWSSPISEH